MSQDREDEKTEAALRSRAEGMRGMPTLEGSSKPSQGFMGSLPHDRCYLLALGFMHYVLKQGILKEDVELLADLFRQEGL